MQTHQPTTLSFSPQQEAILTSLSQGANRASACHAADLPRRTFYNWIRGDPTFAEAVEEAEAEAVGIAEDLAYACAMKAIEDPRYLRALFFWLKHRAGWVQARPDPTSTSTHSVGATGPVALPSEPADPLTLPDPTSPSGDSAPPDENPAPGVPFVPSENTQPSPQDEPASSIRPSSLVTHTSAVSSRQRDKLRFQQFRQRKRN